MRLDLIQCESQVRIDNEYSAEQIFSSLINHSSIIRLTSQDLLIHFLRIRVLERCDPRYIYLIDNITYPFIN